jgi:hypothetical protein
MTKDLIEDLIDAPLEEGLESFITDDLVDEASSIRSP